MKKKIFLLISVFLGIISLFSCTPPQPSDIINDGLPQLPNNVSAELKNLIYQAMQIRKGDRPDSVDFFMRVSSQITNDAEDTMQVDMPEVSYSDAIQVYHLFWIDA